MSGVGRTDTTRLACPRECTDTSEECLTYWYLTWFDREMHGAELRRAEKNSRVLSGWILRQETATTHNEGFIKELRSLTPAGVSDIPTPSRVRGWTHWKHASDMCESVRWHIRVRAWHGRECVLTNLKIVWHIQEYVWYVREYRVWLSVYVCPSKVKRSLCMCVCVGVSCVVCLCLCRCVSDYSPQRSLSNPNVWSLTSSNDFCRGSSTAKMRSSWMSLSRSTQNPQS